MVILEEITRSSRSLICGATTGNTELGTKLYKTDFTSNPIKVSRPNKLYVHSGKGKRFLNSKDRERGREVRKEP
jgi:hypothetical protein